MRLSAEAEGSRPDDGRGGRGRGVAAFEGVGLVTGLRKIALRVHGRGQIRTGDLHRVRVTS